jgi:hypothetical protein
MATEHSTLPEAELHEPKGISAAGVDTVYTADGIGGGSWTAQAGALFGDMDFTANTLATTITTASPTAGDGFAVNISGATLSTPGVLYTQGVVDTVAFENTGNNELLRVPTAGVYEISLNCSFSGGGGGAGNVYRFNFAINGTEQTAHAYALRQAATADIGNVSISEYVLLAANDTIQPMVGNQSGVNDPTISVSSFTCILLKPS